MILVLGGGFGLYGHLAALVGLDHQVATLDRYRPVLRSRPELQDLDQRVEWIEDEAAALARADAVVLARRPDDNAALMARLVASGQGGTLVVEKPIAASPGQAIALADQLEAAQRHWAVPYLFLYCDWFDLLRQRFALDDHAGVTINWSFRQSPKSRAWKRAEEEGGGALAFYFIHCLALAEALLPAATHSWSSQAGRGGGQSICLTAAQNNRTLSIRFDLDISDLAFRIAAGGATLVEDVTPFGALPVANQADPRLPVLQRFYREAVFGTRPQDTSFQRTVNQLWKDMEAYAAA